MIGKELCSTLSISLNILHDLHVHVHSSVSVEGVVLPTMTSAPHAIASARSEVVLLIVHALVALHIVIVVQEHHFFVLVGLLVVPSIVGAAIEVVVLLLIAGAVVTTLQLFELVCVCCADELAVHVEDLALWIHQELALIALDLDPTHDDVIFHVHTDLLVLRLLAFFLHLPIGVVCAKIVVWIHLVLVQRTLRIVVELIVLHLILLLVVSGVVAEVLVVGLVLLAPPKVIVHIHMLLHLVVVLIVHLTVVIVVVVHWIAAAVIAVLVTVLNHFVAHYGATVAVNGHIVIHLVPTVVVWILALQGRELLLSLALLVVGVVADPGWRAGAGRATRPHFILLIIRVEVFLLIWGSPTVP